MAIGSFHTFASEPVPAIRHELRSPGKPFLSFLRYAVARLPDGREPHPYRSDTSSRENRASEDIVGRARSRFPEVHRRPSRRPPRPFHRRLSFSEFQRLSESFETLFC